MAMVLMLRVERSRLICCLCGRCRYGSCIRSAIVQASSGEQMMMMMVVIVVLAGRRR